MTGRVLDADVGRQLVEWIGSTAPDAGSSPAVPLRHLGVDSLDLFRVARRIERTYGASVALRELFAPELTLEWLTRAVAERAGAAVPAAGRGDPHPWTVMTPAQEEAWEAQPANRNHWNQSMLFVTRPGMSEGTLRETVRRVVGGHQSLRLAFEAPPARRPQQHDGGWTDENTVDGIVDVVDLREVPDERLSEAVTLRCELEQGSLVPENGRVLRIVWFDAGPGRHGRLLVVVHQLAFDMVSWQVLLSDLEEVYERLAGGDDDVRCGDGTTYLRWAEAVAAYARSPEGEREAPWWADVVAVPGRVPYDHPAPDPWAVNTAASAATHVEVLSEEETGDVLDAALETHGCHPGTLVLHALGEVLAAWRGDAEMRVDLVRHGRQEEIGGADLSHTTGWFTTTFPVRIDAAPGSAEERLGRTRDHLAALPSGGVGHGALRQHGRPRISAPLRAAAPGEVSYDYQGEAEEEFPIGTVLLDVADEPVGEITGPDWVRPHLIEVIVAVLDDRMRIEWWYATTLHEADTIARLAGRHRAAIARLVV